jgi:hypothetical protein
MDFGRGTNFGRLTANFWPCLNVVRSAPAHPGAGAGCVFVIDTDAHAAGQLDWLGNGCERAERAGITPGRVLNTRTAAGITGA